MSSWTCVAHVEIEATDGKTEGRRTIRLPFPPYPGLEIRGLRDGWSHYGMQEWPGPIETVVWDMALSQFDIYLPDDNASVSEMTLAEIKVEYGVAWAWEDRERAARMSRSEGDGEATCD